MADMIDWLSGSSDSSDSLLGSVAEWKDRDLDGLVSSSGLVIDSGEPVVVSILGVGWSGCTGGSPASLAERLVGGEVIKLVSLDVWLGICHGR
jgi:hypothetical protein